MSKITKEITEDGSTTFFNEKYKQCYHSRVGAYTEALEKHVIPCKIRELADEKSILRILDVCFGLGYNSGLAIQEALKANPAIKLEIIALENDPEILKQIKDMEVPSEYRVINDKLAALAAGDEQDELRSFAEKNLDIKVLLGDARDSIKNLLASIQDEDKFDAVFFDPFSPKECPELWTEEFIQDVVSVTKPGAMISTYSSARIVKDNFAKAGCEISEGPKVGKRSGGVLARAL